MVRRLSAKQYTLVRFQTRSQKLFFYGGDLDELAKKANAIIDAISDEESIALVRKHEKELFGDRKYYCRI